MVSGPIVDAERLREAGVVPLWVDARPGDIGRAAHQKQRLSGAIHVDLDRDLSDGRGDPGRGGRHPLPSAAEFARRLSTWGIDPTDFVVAYDDKGGAFAAARFWWMMRALGHTRVAILDGGLSEAQAAGFLTEAGHVESRPRTDYPAPPTWAGLTVDHDFVRERQSDWLLLDVRAAERYRGEREPIDPVAGHIPGAVNVPYEMNLDEAGRFHSPATLRDVYRSHLGEHAPSNVIVSCGSGVTACHTLAALERAGLLGASLYVGSFSEWCRSGEPVCGEPE